MSGVIVNPYASGGIQTVYDLVDDFGGSLLDWLTFYGSAPAGHYQLNIPAGSFGVYGADTSLFALGNLGATIQGAGMGSTFMTITNPAGKSGLEPNMPEPRIESVSAGSSTVTLLSLADASRFTSAVPDTPGSTRTTGENGWYICLMGWAMQLGGNPANNQFFEFKRVLDVNALTGVVTLEEPIENSYSSDWPAVLPGVAGTTVDCAGAATAYLMVDFDLHFGIPWSWPATRLGWDQELIIRDLTIANTSAPAQVWFGAGRTITWERVNFPGFSGTATVGQSVIYNECLFDGDSVEIDKFVEVLEFNDCSFVGGTTIIFQSSSIGLLRINNTTFDGGFVSLGGRTFEATDTAFTTARIGPSSYGASESGTITNCSATSVALQTARHFPYSDITDITNGIITIDYGTWVAGSAMLDLTPLTSGILQDNFGRYLRCFNILSAEYDSGGDNMLFTTDLPEPIPEIGLVVDIAPHPCKEITISGGTGDLASYNGHNAQPFGEVSTQALTGANGANDGFAYCWGNIVSITVNVSQAYTGAQSVLKLSIFGSGRSMLLSADHTVVTASYNPKVNLKIVGERIITPGSVSGAQSGDSLTSLSIGDNWLCQSVQPYITNDSVNDPVDISSESGAVRPIYTVTVVTDQGL